MADDQQLLPFEGSGRLIRRQWHDGRWFLSVVDVVARVRAVGQRGPWQLLVASQATIARR